MSNSDFHKALETAKREISELMQERTVVDRRIMQLKTTVDTLTTLLGEKAPNVSFVSWEATAEVLNEIGISDSIRGILSKSAGPMTPSQIKTALINAGFPLEGYVSAMAVIHNTLKRLEKQGELMTIRSTSGQIVGYAMRQSS
jgi:hypothetical protein